MTVISKHPFTSEIHRYSSCRAGLCCPGVLSTFLPFPPAVIKCKIPFDGSVVTLIVTSPLTDAYLEELVEFVEFDDRCLIIGDSKALVKEWLDRHASAPPTVFKHTQPEVVFWSQKPITFGTGFIPSHVDGEYTTVSWWAKWARISRTDTRTRINIQGGYGASLEKSENNPW